MVPHPAMQVDMMTYLPNLSAEQLDKWWIIDEGFSADNQEKAIQVRGAMG